MAKASVMCKCEKCGKEFKKEKICHNRAEADNFEEWAKENCTECPECYKARIESQKAEKANVLKEKYNLPEIIGASEKQVAYANSLRDEYIVCAKDSFGVSNFDLIDEMRDELNQYPDRVAKKSAQMGLTEQEYIEKKISRVYPTEYKLLTMTNAGEIIELLKFRVN